MGRYCPHCMQNDLRENARFCHHCGHRLSHQAQQNESTQPIPNPLKPPPHALRTEETQPIESPLRYPSKNPAPPFENEATRPIETLFSSYQALIDSIDNPTGTNSIDVFQVSDEDDIQIGQTLQERYHLQQILGHGGFGRVYLAEDIRLKRRCVVKQMRTKNRTGPALEAYRANFKREADLLVELNHPGHPNIPEIYDTFFDETGNYLVMKYIEGRNLREFVDWDQTLPPKEIVSYAVELCSALHYIHTHGQEPIIHRDIKPANILLGDDDRIWLVDFGLARSNPVDGNFENQLTQAAGSLGYTPLEQWLGQPTETSDIYSLGATLHNVLTGLNPADPFKTDLDLKKLRQLHGQFTPIDDVSQDIPAGLAEIVAAMVRTDASQRPTAIQLKHQLEIFVSGAVDVSLFTFQNGAIAKTKEQLIDLCDRYPQEAQNYLYRGDFEHWFGLINRPDLKNAAIQALMQGRTRKDSLDRFLKLILPNLQFRRLTRRLRQSVRWGVQVLVPIILILLLIAILATYGASWVIQRSITNTSWGFVPTKVGEVTQYNEDRLGQLIQEQTGGLFDPVRVDTEAPNIAQLQARWANLFLIELSIIVEVVD
ncbi:MAG: serine/threonine-protein kinase, partial [Chloroflexota bacterium]